MEKFYLNGSENDWFANENKLIIKGMEIKDGEEIGCIIREMTVSGTYNQKNHSFVLEDGIEWFIDVHVFVGICLWIEG